MLENAFIVYLDDRIEYKKIKFSPLLVEPKVNTNDFCTFYY